MAGHDEKGDSHKEDSLLRRRRLFRRGLVSSLSRLVSSRLAVSVGVGVGVIVVVVVVVVVVLCSTTST